jgi:hypothetical protein
MTEKFSITEIIEATNKLTDNNTEIKKRVNIAIDPQTEKIIFEAEKFLNKNSKGNDVYILKGETLNESRKDSPSSPEEEVEKEENFESEDLKNISRGFKNINKICEILKEKNLELSKNIKNYQNGKMYIDQEEQLKNLKEDNKVLRNKSIKLNINERELRNKIKDLSLDKNITVQESNKLKILITNFENKVKFYSEENAKINVEKHEAMKKLKNSLTQLNELEQDKIKIKNAVGNLNNLLSNSNVDTQTFKKKIKNFSKINKDNSKKNS